MHNVVIPFLVSALLLLGGCTHDARINGAWVQYGGKGWSGFAVEFDDGQYRAWQYSDILIGNMFDPPKQPLTGTYETCGNVITLHSRERLLSPVWFLGRMNGQPTLFAPGDWAALRSGNKVDMAELLMQDPDFDPKNPFADQTEYVKPLFPEGLRFGDQSATE